MVRFSFLLIMACLFLVGCASGPLTFHGDFHACLDTEPFIQQEKPWCIEGAIGKEPEQTP